MARQEPKITVVAKLSELTKRQQEVAYRLALGKTNREISQELGCGLKTVDTHRGAVLQRIGVRNAVELTLRALQERFVKPEDVGIDVSFSGDYVPSSTVAD